MIIELGSGRIGTTMINIGSILSLVVFLLLNQSVKDFSHGSMNQTAVLAQFVNVYRQSHHSKGCAAARLSVGQNRGVVGVELI